MLGSTWKNQEHAVRALVCRSGRKPGSRLWSRVGLLQVKKVLAESLTPEEANVTRICIICTKNKIDWKAKPRVCSECKEKEPSRWKTNVK